MSKNWICEIKTLPLSKEAAIAGSIACFELVDDDGRPLIGNPCWGLKPFGNPCWNCLGSNWVWGLNPGGNPCWGLNPLGNPCGGNRWGGNREDPWSNPGGRPKGRFCGGLLGACAGAGLLGGGAGLWGFGAGLFGAVRENFKIRFAKFGNTEI